MAFTELYCDTNDGSASNMNGGSNSSGAPTYSATNGGWNSGTGVYTPTSGDPSASGVSVGQFCSVFTDGATTPVFVGRVTAVNSTTVTVSTTAKSGTAPTTAGSGISINVGGVWKGPNGAVAFPFGFVTSTLTDASSNAPRVNFKNAATYSITAAMTHANNGPTVFRGYTSSAGDGGKAVIDGGSSGASYVPLTLSGSSALLADVIIQNNGASGTAAGLALSGNQNCVERVVVNSVRGAGFSVSGSATVYECEAYSCNQSNTANLGGFAVSTTSSVGLTRCVSHDNSGGNSSGFVYSGGSAGGPVLIDCVADTNGADGFRSTGAATVTLSGCVFHNNASDGCDLAASAATNALVQNCVFVSNAGYGVNAASASRYYGMRNNAFYNNTSGQTNNVNASLIVGSITLTGDPFVDAANGDFDLNNTAGAGAACRGAGAGTFTQTAASYTGTLGYPDIGASQHQDSGSGTTPLAQAALGSRSIGTY